MSRVPHREIIADPEYRQKLKAATKKAEIACEKVRTRLNKQEEKLLAKLSEISEAKYAIFVEVYCAVFDPLDEAAYADAERRLASRLDTD